MAKKPNFSLLPGWPASFLCAFCFLMGNFFPDLAKFNDFLLESTLEDTNELNFKVNRNLEFFDYEVIELLPVLESSMAGASSFGGSGSSSSPARKGRSKLPKMQSAAARPNPHNACLASSPSTSASANRNLNQTGSKPFSGQLSRSEARKRSLVIADGQGSPPSMSSTTWTKYKNEIINQLQFLDQNNIIELNKKLSGDLLEELLRENFNYNDKIGVYVKEFKQKGKNKNYYQVLVFHKQFNYWVSYKYVEKSLTNPSDDYLLSVETTNFRGRYFFLIDDLELKIQQQRYEKNPLMLLANLQRKFPETRITFTETDVKVINCLMSDFVNFLPTVDEKVKEKNSTTKEVFIDFIKEWVRDHETLENSIVNFNNLPKAFLVWAACCPLLPLDKNDKPVEYVRSHIRPASELRRLNLPETFDEFVRLPRFYEWFFHLCNAISLYSQNLGLDDFSYLQSDISVVLRSALPDPSKFQPDSIKSSQHAVNKDYVFDKIKFEKAKSSISLRNFQTPYVFEMSYGP